MLGKALVAKRGVALCVNAGLPRGGVATATEPVRAQPNRALSDTLKQ
jgi:hypothetical protein